MTFEKMKSQINFLNIYLFKKFNVMFYHLEYLKVTSLN